MLWFNIIIGSVTLLIGIITLFVVYLTYLKMVTKPHVVVGFWENNTISKEASLKPGDQTLYFLFREVFQASPSGKFKGMKYIAVPSAYKVRPPAISILSYEEDVLCKVKLNVPHNSRITEYVHVQMTSREGDLGVHELVINVRKENS